MATIKINDDYYVDVSSYNFTLMKRGRKSDKTIGYYPSLKHVLAKLKREEIALIGNVSIDEYISELRKLENWTGDILNE